MAKNDHQGVPVDPLDAFLITRAHAQPRPLQSMNLKSSSLKSKASNPTRTAAQADADQGASNAVDIFRELDAEGADVMGEELGYRGMEDSEHEDSEGGDVEGGNLYRPEAHAEDVDRD